MDNSEKVKEANRLRMQILLLIVVVNLIVFISLANHSYWWRNYRVLTPIGGLAYFFIIAAWQKVVDDSGTKYPGLDNKFLYWTFLLVRAAAFVAPLIAILATWGGEWE